VPVGQGNSVQGTATSLPAQHVQTAGSVGACIRLKCASFDHVPRRLTSAKVCLMSQVCLPRLHSPVSIPSQNTPWPPWPYLCHGDLHLLLGGPVPVPYHSQHTAQLQVAGRITGSHACEAKQHTTGCEWPGVILVHAPLVADSNCEWNVWHASAESDCRLVPQPRRPICMLDNVNIKPMMMTRALAVAQCSLTCRAWHTGHHHAAFNSHQPSKPWSSTLC
jgi:hypothetical protein